MEIIERKFKERQENVTAAKEDIEKILKWITNEVSDKLTGYGTTNMFCIQSRYWDQSNWEDAAGKAIFRIYQGKARIEYAGEYEDENNNVDIEDLEYININDAAEAMEEFLGDLEEMENFKLGEARLNKIKKELEKTE